MYILPPPLFMGEVLSEERQLIKWTGILQVGIFCVGIFLEGSLMGGNFMSGNVPVGNFPRTISLKYKCDISFSVFFFTGSKFNET